MVTRMGRRQVLVQLDDALVDRLDRSAGALELNRSELIREAVRAYLDACEEATWDLRTVRAYLEVPEDPHELEALQRLAASAWPPA
jgi:metal-responsive CopG/Arc/MetJ family transcriptional regulator